jgi:urease accessory protein
MEQTTHLTVDSLDQQFVLLQLADSFFPSGAYTLSHGLESLVQANWVRATPRSGAEGENSDLAVFLQLLLRNKIEGVDLVALAHAHSASAQNDLVAIAHIDALLFAQTPIEKTRLSQRQSGRALLMVAQETWPHPHLAALLEQTNQGTIHCLHPVIFAVVAQIVGLDASASMAAFVHGLVTGLLGAAIRLGVVGHLQAQQIRRSLNTDMAEACQAAAQLSLDEMWAAAPLIDIAQMRQAKLARRLFAS